VIRTRLAVEPELRGISHAVTSLWAEGRIKVMYKVRHVQAIHQHSDRQTGRQTDRQRKRQRQRQREREREREREGGGERESARARERGVRKRTRMGCCAYECKRE
jgi:hypothetical protein